VQSDNKNSINGMQNLNPLDQLRSAILNGDKNLAVSAAGQVINQKIDPLEAAKVVTEALSVIGNGFAKGELFLPDMMLAGSVVEASMALLEEEIKKEGKESQAIGTVVIGTVLGDIHSIGKTMVATLLKAAGFKVYDLGIDVSSEKFVEAIRQYKPDILAMSALLTTTMSEQRKVIEHLKQEGLKKDIKIMIGGGPVTEEFSDSIGADGYDPTAPGAVSLALRLLNK